MPSTPAGPPATPVNAATLPPGTVAVSAQALRRALAHLNTCGISAARRGGAVPSVVDVAVTEDAVTVRRSDGNTDATVTVPDLGSTRRPHLHEPLRMEFADLGRYVRQAEEAMGRKAFRAAQVTITPVLPGLVRVQVAGDGDNGPVLPAHSVPEHDRSLPLIRYPQVATWDRAGFCLDIARARRTVDVPDKPGDLAARFDQIRAEFTPGQARLVATDSYRLTVTGWRDVRTDDALIGALSLVVLPGVVTGRVAKRFAKLDAATVTLEVSRDGRVTVLECGPLRMVLRLPQGSAAPRDITWPARERHDAAVTVNRAELAALVADLQAARQKDPYETSPHLALALAADGTVSVGQADVDKPVTGTLHAVYHGFTIDPENPLRVAFQLEYLVDVLDAFTGDTLTLTGRTGWPRPPIDSVWPQAEPRTERTSWIFTDQPGQSNDTSAYRYLVMPLDKRGR